MSEPSQEVTTAFPNDDKRKKEAGERQKPPKQRRLSPGRQLLCFRLWPRPVQVTRHTVGWHLALNTFHSQVLLTSISLSVGESLVCDPGPFIPMAPSHYMSVHRTQNFHYWGFVFLSVGMQNFDLKAFITTELSPPLLLLNLSSPLSSSSNENSN